MNASIQEILRNGSMRLKDALGLEIGSARIEVQCLLQAVLNVDRAWLLSHPEQTLNDKQLPRYTALVERRLEGEPVAYILGEREFYGLNFIVSPATLIPRPETELLVELVLQRVPNPLPASPTPPGLPLHPQGVRRRVPRCCAATLPQSGEGQRSDMSAFRVLDLGTGCGAIALSIAQARTDIKVVAVDASQDALLVARENAQRLNINNVSMLQSNWYSALQGERFDLIVSNPPYVASGDAHLTQGDLRFEPLSALVSGADGLDDIRHIITQAKTYLNPGAWLLFEHGHDQAERARALLQQAGFTGILSACDLAGIERVSGGN